MERVRQATGFEVYTDSKSKGTRKIEAHPGSIQPSEEPAGAIVYGFLARRFASSFCQFLAAIRTHNPCLELRLQAQLIKTEADQILDSSPTTQKDFKPRADRIVDIAIRIEAHCL
jgi:hypothetical protein